MAAVRWRAPAMSPTYTDDSVGLRDPHLLYVVEFYGIDGNIIDINIYGTAKAAHNDMVKHANTQHGLYYTDNYGIPLYPKPSSVQVRPSHTSYHGQWIPDRTDAKARQWAAVTDRLPIPTSKEQILDLIQIVRRCPSTWIGHRPNLDRY